MAGRWPTPARGRTVFPSRGSRNRSRFPRSAAPEAGWPAADRCAAHGYRRSLWSGNQTTRNAHDCRVSLTPVSTRPQPSRRSIHSRSSGRKEHLPVRSQRLRFSSPIPMSRSVGTDVHIAHDQHRILFVEFGLQIVLQILIERRFGREFGFMIAAFTLREIAVNHRDVAEGRRDLRHNDAALSLFAIVRETAADGNRRLFGQQRDAIMAFLPVIKTL